MIFHFCKPGPTQNKKERRRRRKKKHLGVSDAVKHPSVQNRMSSETFWKQQNQAILEKPEGGGDVLDCRQHSAAQLSAVFLQKLFSRQELASGS